MEYISIAMLIITYNPNINLLMELLVSIINQVNYILIIDNGSVNIDLIRNIKINKLSIHELGTNEGIAKATNIGISQLNKYDYVLLSDQDTLYPQKYISEFKKIQKDLKVAAYSPIFYETKTMEISPIYKLEKGRIRKRRIENNIEEIYQTIASGLIINLDILRTIGGMNEDLFIDFVDFEWCWRVNYFGYKIICNKKMKISHSIGDNNKKIFKKQIYSHSLERNYYITRNCMYLSLYSKYISKRQKGIYFIKSFLYVIGFTIFEKEHLNNLIYTTYGLIHGILAKIGKMPKDKGV